MSVIVDWNRIDRVSRSKTINYCARHGLSLDDAEDVAQDVLIKMAHSNTVAPTVVAKCKIIDLARRKRRRKSCHLNEAEDKILIECPTEAQRLIAESFESGEAWEAIANAAGVQPWQVRDYFADVFGERI